MSFHKQESNH